MFDTLLGTGGEDGPIVVVVQAPVMCIAIGDLNCLSWCSHRYVILRITFLWYKTQYRLATRLCIIMYYVLSWIEEGHSCIIQYYVKPIRNNYTFIINRSCTSISL